MKHFQIHEPYKNIISIILIIIVATAIALSIRFFFLESFSVNGESMQPTYHTGDLLLVDKFSYKFSSPSRGDVVVIRYPQDPSEMHIKRIIGLPNETVVLEDGVVKIQQPGNQQAVALNEPYLSSGQRTDPTPNSISTFPLGEDEYFVLGDNRLDSADSRSYYGGNNPTPLYRDFIIGKALVRLWPLGNITFARTPKYSLE